jgi:hypothetical protein
MGAVYGQPSGLCVLSACSPKLSRPSLCAFRVPRPREKAKQRRSHRVWAGKECLCGVDEVSLGFCCNAAPTPPQAGPRQQMAVAGQWLGLLAKAC